ncbi:MAG: ABC transporter permease [Candidatus Rokubacteria bacterium]|nr:ABC transporter permease [Candidatus Rokubacteria bacterium]
MSRRIALARLWLSQLRVLTAKELRQIVRDRVLFAFVAWMFTVNIVLSAGEVGTELHRAALLVHDGDRTAASRELVHRFQPPYFNVLGEVSSGADGARRIDRGEAVILLDIPARFGDTLAAGREPATVQVLVDTTNASAGYLAASYSARIGARMGQEWTAGERSRHGAPPRLPAVEARTRVWYNPELNEAWFGMLSELLTMLTVACVLLPATALVRERERGTIEQLLVSPLGPAQVMLAKVLATTLVTEAGAAVAVLGIMHPVYGMPIRGSLVLFFALAALYTFTGAGLGMVAATFTRKTGQVGLLMLLIVMPIVMLSGIRTPWESMPAWLRAVMTLSPLHHFVDVSYGIVLRGAGPAVLWDSILAMVGLGAALFAVGVWRFRRQFG